MSDKLPLWLDSKTVIMGSVTITSAAIAFYYYRNDKKNKEICEEFSKKEKEYKEIIQEFSKKEKEFNEKVLKFSAEGAEKWRKKLEEQTIKLVKEVGKLEYDYAIMLERKGNEIELLKIANKKIAKEHQQLKSKVEKFFSTFRHNKSANTKNLEPGREGNENTSEKFLFTSEPKKEHVAIEIKPTVDEKLKQVKSGLPAVKVIVHPLVLFSITDHFNRVTKVGRVVGVLLGSWKEGETLDVSDIPFGEAKNDNSVSFMDYEYLEKMHAMTKQINGENKIVGWYRTGSKLDHNDISVNKWMKKFAQRSVLVIVDDVQSKELDLPTVEAYMEVEEAREEGKPPVSKFKQIPIELGMEQIEELAVKQLRDIKDHDACTFINLVTNEANDDQSLAVNLGHIQKYLKRVVDGEIPTNQAIIYLVQDMLNLISDSGCYEFFQSANVQINDRTKKIYSDCLLSLVATLGNLVNEETVSSETEEKSEKKDEQKNGESSKELSEKIEKI